ncbi:hypothetical protein, conserved [Trypanosoma brucei gambiense DAL972]|uniref:Uncharacterized protein n=2 Tax=Trypanosoma brucei TaxID=5691 RepID=Q581Y1_TRYB2|nr:hypothetical protein, conserved [Trypanosoma brucei gambiense DAL972]XP_847034.1 hypothetical protein, conserved [Trypanosoma brucei brucei TREU927]AAX79422.1 hypothetical protein, conserved [Trypanosoma brucei]AAZ12968.1 hypothetical protein, conserved [Trypanosoma brucei brucei TREU927]CBH13217.1 hypothetical protein, conserved [Trypanosoma brucei gambiense DAL972]|eukprot:XP_011775494.1 hypothetical protein, conserved [Trypanosoma brucei gambiense DAL972]
MLRGRWGIFQCTLIFRASFHDVRSKKMWERRQRELQKAGEQMELDEDVTPPPSIPRSSRVATRDESCEGDKEAMLALLQEQWQRRVARREAFIQWQAGQREKGAAQRLVRQAKTQEKFKSHRYHTQSGRIISVGLAREDGTSSNSDASVDLYSVGMCGSQLRSADFLVQPGSRNTHGTVNLVLQKR